MLMAEVSGISEGFCHSQPRSHRRTTGALPSTLPGRNDGVSRIPLVLPETIADDRELLGTFPGMAEILANHLELPGHCRKNCNSVV